MMEPTRAQLAQLADALSRTRPEEIDCEQILDLLAQCAEIQVQGGTLPRELITVSQHLEVCPECVEEFESLLALCREQLKDGN